MPPQARGQTAETPGLAELCMSLLLQTICWHRVCHRPSSYKGHARQRVWWREHRGPGRPTHPDPVFCLKAPRQAPHYETPPFSLRWGPSTSGPRLVTPTASQSSPEYAKLRRSELVAGREAQSAGPRFATHVIVFISFFSASGRARFSTLRKSDVFALIRV